jgi:hypothetical protein
LDRVLLGQLRQRVGARDPADPAQEGLAEQVRRLAARPGIERVDRLVLLREAPVERRHPQHHPRVGVAAAAEGRALGLLVRGEALDHPRHREAVREKERRPAEQRAARAPDAARFLEVHGMRELVAQHQPQPALVVAEAVAAVRRHRTDRHQRVGQRRREPVRQVVGVDDHELDAAELRAVARLVVRQDLARDRGGRARQLFEALVEVNRDPVGVDRAEMVLGRIGRGVRDGRGGERHHQDRRQGRQPAGRGAKHPCRGA